MNPRWEARKKRAEQEGWTEVHECYEDGDRWLIGVPPNKKMERFEDQIVPEFDEETQ